MRAGSALLGYVCVLFACIGSAYAGAWTQDEGRALLATSVTYYTGNKFFDGSGTLHPQSRYQKHETSLYGEWGWLEGLTLGTNLFVSHATQSGKHNYSLSNPEFFARARIYKDDKRVISLQPLIKLPTQAYRGRGPQSGNEATEMEIALLYGESVRYISDHDFVDFALALRKRNHGLAPQWRTEAKYGIRLTDAIQLISALYVTQSLTRDATAFREGGDLDYHLAKAEVSGMYTLNERRYWQLSGFSHIAGTQTGAGYGTSLSYGMRF